VLALLFLVAYAWPILQPGISSSWRHVCTVADLVIWVVFVIEFITRLVLADRRGHYAVRHVPDVLMVALPVLRPFGLLRFLVLLRMLNRRATAPTAAISAPGCIEGFLAPYSSKEWFRSAWS
jgi:voltage-gated potassium channel